MEVWDEVFVYCSHIMSIGFHMSNYSSYSWLYVQYFVIFRLYVQYCGYILVVRLVSVYSPMQGRALSADNDATPSTERGFLTPDTRPFLSKRRGHGVRAITISALETAKIPMFRDLA